jgi:fructokinase
MTAIAIGEIAERVRTSPRKGKRRLVAIAGPPASGKSQIAEALAEHLNGAGCPTQVVPMDGFHLHNEILAQRGMLSRKGSPETFDVHGFLNLVSRLRNEPEVFFPTFDRARDIAIAGAGRVDGNCDTIIVEGNYLLLDAPVWRDLLAHWDLSARLDVSDIILQNRLVARWLSYGLSKDQALTRAEENDLVNARLVKQLELPADLIV